MTEQAPGIAVAVLPVTQTDIASDVSDTPDTVAPGDVCVIDGAQAIGLPKPGGVVVYTEVMYGWKKDFMEKGPR